MTERRQLQERLMQSQKMEALGQLAGGVAHDFNNLLTIITACASFVLEASPPEDVAVDVREILGASDRAAGLTRQLLAFSRRQMLKTEIVDVNASLGAMEKSLARLIGENIEIVVSPNARHSTTEVDVHQLEQVILNLVVNARDAMADGGTISLETTNCSALADDGTEREYVAISVSDTGTGIEPSIRDRLFDPFFTTKSVGKGTGLGLAIVHGIVEQSGGRVEVESVVGEGSTFRILLPVIASEGSIAPFESDEAQLRGTETILLVEDESVLRSVMRRVLTDHGYAVLEARHGGDAARLSASFDGRIDLLVTDLIMPELGGRELAELVRGQRPNTPVLYVSGYTDDELLRKGVLERGAQLLRKPFVPSELALAVRQLLNEQAVLS
ncbi:MAG: ATP-binding protein [Gemmatimonadota bacterium]